MGGTLIEQLLAGTLEAPTEAPAPAPEEFFHTRPPELRLATEGVQPPTPLYIAPGDRLLLQAVNAAPNGSITVALRLLLPDGTVQRWMQHYSLPSDRSLSNWFIPLAEGFLLSFLVLGEWPVRSGACLVRAQIISGFGGDAYVIPQLLVNGYAGTLSSLAWPSPRYVVPGEGPGWLRIINGTNPAPGNTILETVPTCARWKFHSICCSLTTDATAGNRYVYLYCQDAGGWWIILPSVVSQPPSNTYSYTWTIGVQTYNPAILGLYVLPLPQDLWLTAGQQFGIVALGQAAGDDFNAPRYQVEEWVEL